VIRNTFSRRAALTGILTASGALAWQAQKGKQKQPDGPRPYPVPPDVSNGRYGPHERNVFDLWQAKTERPSPLVLHIHGGGFTAGDKSGVPQPLLNECLKRGIAVATINYRYSTIAPYPAPFADSTRALQYIRLHAKEWNINPKAVACTGGSAGAGISLWIGFRDDMAQPSSSDPVLRQSTRISVVGVTNAQTSYDPRFVAKLVGEPTGRHPALAKLFGVPEGQDVMTATDKFRIYDEGAPVMHLNAGDPPVFMFYSRELHLPPSNLGEGIHSPQFGIDLKGRMDKLGIECVVRTPKDYKEAGNAQALANQEMVSFFQKYFRKLT
jgi:acetyl esterase/lipase